MRLGIVLVVSFLAIAALVGLVGQAFSVTSDEVRHELEDLRRSSIASVVSATELRFSLQASQLEAEKLIAERYRDQVDASHESEWNVAGSIDLGDIEDSLDEFEEQLTVSWQTVETAREITGRQHGLATVEAEIGVLSARLRAVEKEFGVYRDKVDRFIHLARYHPSDQVREFVDDELISHYRDTMLPTIRGYERQTKTDLMAEVDRIAEVLVTGNRRNRMISGLALAGAVLLGLLITRWITGPIAKLKEAALAVGRGHFETPVEIRTHSELGLLARAFNQMTEDLRESTVSRSHLDKILQSMQDMLLVTDAGRNVRTVNRLAQETLGYENGELIGHPIDRLTASDSGVLPTAESPSGAGETILVGSDGQPLPVSYSSAVLTDEDGGVEGQVFVLRDIRERKSAEEALHRSLAEKESLLKEVHHRVKNNLQIVSSLLHLQEQDLTDAAAVRQFHESQNRIRSMALIHEQLYKSRDLANIDFATYLGQLVDHLISSYGGAGERISVDLEVDPAPLNIDYAIPCGLIVNELVANSIEHAFPDGQGAISVRFSAQKGRHLLEFEDNGVGLPPNTDPSTASSLGLKLVDALVAQLGGDYEFEVADGTTFRLSFESEVVGVGKQVAS